MKEIAGKIAKTTHSTFKGVVMNHHFVILAIIGNFVVALFAWLFWQAEFGVNPAVDEPMDAIWWAFTTVTTVGFGDIVPVTFWGRITGITLMVVGTVLFATYIALVANTFISTKKLHQHQKE
ncbi:MAG: two pore domain potassium channel family protein [Deltaproteobacteria bacterium]|nr:two pore domain potassium channel family protein [Deltaproteobacteria bacterium]